MFYSFNIMMPKLIHPSSSWPTILLSDRALQATPHCF